MLLASVLVAGFWIAPATPLSSMAATGLKTPTTTTTTRVTVVDKTSPQQQKRLVNRNNIYTVSLRPRPPWHVPPPIHLFDQIVIMEDGVVEPHDNGLYDEYDGDDEVVSMQMLYQQQDAGAMGALHDDDYNNNNNIYASTDGVSAAVTGETESNAEWMEEQSVMMLHHDDQTSPRLNWVVTKVGETTGQSGMRLKPRCEEQQAHNIISLEEQTGRSETTAVCDEDVSIADEESAKKTVNGIFESALKPSSKQDQHAALSETVSLGHRGSSNLGPASHSRRTPPTFQSRTFRPCLDLLVASVQQELGSSSSFNKGTRRARARKTGDTKTYMLSLSLLESLHARPCLETAANMV